MITVVNKKLRDFPNEDVYIGRGSVFGNPFTHVHSEHPQVQERVNTREEAIAKYKDYAQDMLRSGDPEFCHAFNELFIKHKRGEEVFLSCFCHPLSCHGDVLKEMLENNRYCVNWFSNMRPLDKPFVYQGVEYHAVENFYQAMKLPKDRVDLRAEIAAATPYESKRAIRKMEIDPEWTREKGLKVMEYAIKQKFARDTSWGKKLINFKKTIIETNNWGDTFWGVDIFSGEGENHLGVLLEKQRARMFFR